MKDVEAMTRAKALSEKPKEAQHRKHKRRRRHLGDAWEDHARTTAPSRALVPKQTDAQTARSAREIKKFGASGAIIKFTKTSPA